MTVAEVCDWYLEHARAGKILGRKRRPIKASTLDLDASRIETHIKPLIGSRSVRSLTLADIEGMQADIVAGRTTKRKRKKGVEVVQQAARVWPLALSGRFRGLLGHAARWKLIPANPAAGVRQIASKKRERRLSGDEVRALGKTMRTCAADGEHPTGLAAIRLMLLTGFRRLEALALQRAHVSENDHCVRFPDTKSGAQVRVIGGPAIEVVKAQPVRRRSSVCVPGRLRRWAFHRRGPSTSRVCRRAELSGVTPHVLRHTFASIAAELEFTELTIAGLLGHASQGVTQRYVHLDAALVLAANQVSRHIAQLLDSTGETSSDATPEGALSIAAE